ncbi:hypothetical protein Tco_0747484 [Tanacetum coccineum]|uniref:Uncharacterized protein n=1 Tax=Tanacetum coccineum TaxID=301880 RepID=A0ABQ4YVW7_9ASTR
MPSHSKDTELVLIGELGVVNCAERGVWTALSDDSVCDANESFLAQCWLVVGCWGDCWVKTVFNELKIVHIRGTGEDNRHHDVGELDSRFNWSGRWWGWKGEVMAAPTIPISVEENLGDPIDIRDAYTWRSESVKISWCRTLLRIEQQLAAIQESYRQDREDFRKLKKLMTSQFEHRS